MAVCNERIFSGWRHHRCGKPAKHDPDSDGNFTRCGIHCAAAVEKRRAKSDAKMAAEKTIRLRNAAINKATNALLPAMREIAAGHNDPRALAQAVIAELDAAYAIQVPK